MDWSVGTPTVQVTIELKPSRIVGWGQGGLQAAFDPAEFTVNADANETLGALIARTAGRQLEAHAAAMGAPGDTCYSVSFLVPEAGTSEDAGELAVLDGDGRLRILNARRATLRDLLASHCVGLLAGDPRQIVVRPEPPPAGVGGVGWETFVEALHVLWDVAEDMAVVGGAAGAAKWIVSRLRRTAATLERHAGDLDDAGIRPPELPRLIALKAWTTPEVAAALGMSAEEATIVLSGLGFDRGTDGLWRPTDDPAGRRLAAELLQLAWSYEAVVRDHERLAARYREYLRRLLEGKGVTGVPSPAGLSWDR